MFTYLVNRSRRYRSKCFGGAGTGGRVYFPFPIRSVIDPGLCRGVQQGNYGE